LQEAGGVDEDTGGDGGDQDHRDEHDEGPDADLPSFVCVCDPFEHGFLSDLY
jgi:hypothetical protein